MSKKIKILIVEDRKVDRYLLRKMLESNGHEVKEAADGQEGLEMLRLQKPDLIISDALMPVMDGFRFLRNIKKDEDLKTIPFIFYSSVYTGSIDGKLALALGARAFIEKPSPPDEFLEKLKAVIQQIEAKEQLAPVELIEDEEEYLRNYSDVVATKLEEKVAELEKVNERLQIEIEERKKAKEELRRINRTLKMLSECNQVVVRAREEPHLLSEMCRIIVEVGGYRLAWVGFAEYDEAKTVRPVVQTGYEEGYLDTVNITWANKERGRGPTGTAIRTGKPCVVKDILTDPKYTPWRAEASKRGYESEIALPLNADDRVLGALNIYAAEPDAFDAEEVKLLIELADDLAYGIMTLRTAVERKKAESELEKHREHLEELVKERTAELEEKNAELERMNKLFVGREFRIKELRDRVKELELKIED